MTDSSELRLVGDLAGFDKVVKTDGEGHHLRYAGESTLWLRSLFAAGADDFLGAATASKVELVGGG